jgi:peptidoglycan/LPS O-acetylase OafA/YrhL
MHDESSDQRGSGLSAPPGARIACLDAIRFVAAIWVVMSHGAVPLKPLFSDPVARLVAGGLGASFDGISAVMVFFIVSGLCIHMPYVTAESVPVFKFLIRRYARIGIPLGTILIIMTGTGGKAFEAGNEVLWSIYAELIYYSIYPILFVFGRKFGWRALIFYSSAISIGLTVWYIKYTHVWQFGWLTWLWGLPIWLSGCLLAQRLRVEQLKNELRGNVWLWRAAAWGLVDKT